MFQTIKKIKTIGYCTETLYPGEKFFELSNHLQNVLVTISDKKIGVDVSPVDGIIDYYTADVITANDFYPGGMLMPGRKYTAGNLYRYGFNGKENDNEIKGEGNQQDYGLRIYDPRLVRFLSVDPLAPDYPWYTPYQFAGNMPIRCIDLDGGEPDDVIYNMGNLDNTELTVTNQKIVNGIASGVGKAINGTWNFVRRDAWKASTWKNIGLFLEEGIHSTSFVKVAETPRIDAAVQNFKDKVINGDAFTRSEYFAEFGTNLAIGYLTDKGLGNISSLKVFTNIGKEVKSGSIRFTQNTVNDFAEAVTKVGSGKYDPIDIVKMQDGIYSTVDNTRLLAAQKLGIDLKATAHTFDEALPEGMLNRFKNNKTGEYAKTWGQAVEYRVGNQTGGYAKTYEGTGSFVQPEVKSQ